MHIGGGYTLPPHDLERFPALHGASVVNRDELTLSVVNDAVRRLGLRSLERLPQPFAVTGGSLARRADDPYRRFLQSASRRADGRPNDRAGATAMRRI